ncbi:MAG: GNAT family N-acetyltransferase [Gaiellales bacterium]
MIRPAAGADLAELESLWERYRHEAADDRCADAEAWRRWMRPRISAGDVRVGMIDRRIAAYVAWQRSAVSAAGARELRVLELYVHPEGRGQRLGSGLLARAIDAARQRGCDALEMTANVHDEGVRGLAEPFGFTLAGGALRLQLQRR